MASDQTLAAFRTRVAQLRRQRWRQMEYSEDPPEALMYMPDGARDTFRAKGAGTRSGGRQTGWRRVYVNAAGKVAAEDVEPPAPPEAAEQPDTPEQDAPPS